MSQGTPQAADGAPGQGVRIGSDLARASAVFLLSLIGDSPAGITTAALRDRLLAELRDRDRTRPLRYGLDHSGSLWEWILWQSARGAVAVTVDPQYPEDAALRLTAAGHQLVADAPSGLREMLGFRAHAAA